ncbi:MAG: FmdE family protein [Candidatus Adiutrix sp.]|jgi:formylmethanofuran dehydrogenase subunit E|nr:FmdE family protein [Candidatus Adiutrix sp.]
METTWQQDLERAIAYHGHLCGGQILGVRMARAGLRWLGLEQGTDLKDLVVFLESDRCIADAVYVITGLTLGRRRVKLMPYGKTAMSFLDLATGRACRLTVKVKDRAPKGVDLVDFWSGYSDDELLDCRAVEIKLPPEEGPGKPVFVARCDQCGDEIIDRREVLREGRTLCRACLGDCYYRVIGA